MIEAEVAAVDEVVAVDVVVAVEVAVILEGQTNSRKAKPRENPLKKAKNLTIKISKIKKTKSAG